MSLKNLNYFPEPIGIPEKDYLYYQTSGIPNAGNGLFTSIRIHKNEIIAIFHGEILSPSSAKKRAAISDNSYFMDLPGGRVLDAIHTEGFAKYANDALGTVSANIKNNAVITLSELGEVCLVAIKAIKPGEEIFCSYGINYWKHRTGNPAASLN